MAASADRKVRPSAAVQPPVLDNQGKILPVQGKRNILITSALPYVNNAPHLGNIIGSTLSGDVFARYCRVAPDSPQVLHVCGTDEYGTTTETKALEEKVTPQQLCDKYHVIHKDSYDWFNIQFDFFGRTTTPQQTEICQEIFTDLYNHGHLVEHEMEQVYCEKDARFLADRFVEGTCPKCGAPGARGDQCDACCQTLDAIDLVDKICKICKTAPHTKKSKHLFIDLPNMQTMVQEWYEEARKRGHWSSNGRAFTEAWLRDGLKERCLTRDLKWGVPVPLPGWEGKVMYVWFDAPIGYPSITANYTSEWRQWWMNPDNVTLYQFMGKDNIPFHTIFFPAYLLGTKKKWTMLQNISTTEYLQYENVKFSKSNNVGVFGQNARDTGVPPEVWRYFLLATRPETQDSQFTWTDFISRANGELLNNIGNFVNRVMKFCIARFSGTVPDPAQYSESAGQGENKSWSDRESFSDVDKPFVNDLNESITQYIEACESIKLRQALSIAMQISGRGNQYLQDNKLDNALLASSPQRCAEVILIGLNAVYLIGALIGPFMPTTTDLINKQLNTPPRRIPTKFGIDLLPGHVLGESVYLFRRIDPDRAAFWRKMYGGNSSSTDNATSPAGGIKTKKSAGGKAAAAKATADVPAYTFPKTPELIELEKQVAEQGNRVRAIKGGKIEGSTSEEVVKLLKVKEQLRNLVATLSNVQITTAPE